jgi:phosphoribosylformylglycinamidine cyclo-ligase
VKYAESGVDIDAATRALARAKEAIRSTWDERVKSDVGAFGGLYQPAPGEPLLVASVDGVGTKVQLARLCNRYDTVGQDLVNHCVNDILVQGAEPLFFLDYFAASKLDEAILPEVLAGFATACRENGCALLGGETAEMPGVYREGEFDLAGAIVGRVAADAVIDGRALREGDRVWGLPSTGLHTNGFSLARKVLLEQAGLAVTARPPELGGASLGETLLAVHRSYLRTVQGVWEAHGRDAVHGLVHVTGGGFIDNVPRIVPDGLRVAIDPAAWETPPIFRLIAELGGVERREMYRVFNMGIGMICITDRHVDSASSAAADAVEIGVVTAGDSPLELPV